MRLTTSPFVRAPGVGCLHAAEVRCWHEMLLLQWKGCEKWHGFRDDTKCFCYSERVVRSGTVSVMTRNAFVTVKGLWEVARFLWWHKMLLLQWKGCEKWHSFCDDTGRKACDDCCGDCNIYWASILKRARSKVNCHHKRTSKKCHNKC
jgi:hypothetical protein